MSAFRDKSNFNTTGAQFLQNQHNLYDPSIHCSYYACIQEFLHIIFTKLKIPQQQFNSDRRNNKDGTHGWASKLIELEIARKDRQDFKWFQKAFPELKLLRENADYSEIKASIDQSREAQKLSLSIINTLKKLFK